MLKCEAWLVGSPNVAPMTLGDVEGITVHLPWANTIFDPVYVDTFDLSDWIDDERGIVKVFRYTRTRRLGDA